MGDVLGASLAASHDWLLPNFSNCIQLISIGHERFSTRIPIVSEISRLGMMHFGVALSYSRSIFCNGKMA